jgi:hypothetical protein
MIKCALCDRESENGVTVRVVAGAVVDEVAVCDSCLPALVDTATRQKFIKAFGDLIGKRFGVIGKMAFIGATSFGGKVRHAR